MSRSKCKIPLRLDFEDTGGDAEVFAEYSARLVFLDKFVVSAEIGDGIVIAKVDALEHAQRIWIELYCHCPASFFCPVYTPPDQRLQTSNIPIAGYFTIIQLLSAIYKCKSAIFLETFTPLFAIAWLLGAHQRILYYISPSLGIRRSVFPFGVGE